jgi:hypothetical protein
MGRRGDGDLRERDGRDLAKQVAKVDTATGTLVVSVAQWGELREVARAGGLW